MKHVLLTALAAIILASIGTAYAAKPPPPFEGFTPTDLVCHSAVGCDDVLYPGTPTDIPSCVEAVLAGPTGDGSYTAGLSGPSDLDIFKFYFSVVGGTTLGTRCAYFELDYPIL